MYTKQEYLALFKGYIIDETEIGLRINLPSSLIAHILGFYPQNDYIDMEWYQKEAYKDHPYSLFDIENKKQNYLKKYDEWRDTLKIKNRSNSYESQNNVNSFKEILTHSLNHENFDTIVIGESHDHLLSKAILMHNIAFLKEKNAILFLEGIYSEMQDEFNKSVNARKPTPLVKAFLINVKKSFESNSYYTQKNLIRTFIQEGIPIIACDNFFSIIFGESCRMEGDVQIGHISRMTMNYECSNAISYAKKNFPHHSFSIFLAGDAHAYTYRSQNDIHDVHPGLVDITSGLYVNAMDTVKQFRHIKACQINISKDQYFQIVNSFGVLKEESAKALENMLFSKSNVTSLNQLRAICRMELPFENRPDNLSQTVTTTIQNYVKYAQINPAQMSSNSLIEGYASSVNGGYQIIAQNESEIVEWEGKLLFIMDSPLPASIEPEYVIAPDNQVIFTKVTTDEIKRFILDTDVLPGEDNILTCNNSNSTNNIQFFSQQNRAVGLSNEVNMSENNHLNLCNKSVNYQADYQPRALTMPQGSIVCNNQIAEYTIFGKKPCDFVIIDNGIENLKKFLVTEIQNITLRNKERISKKAEQLQYILTWLQGETDTNPQQELYVFNLVHSVCALTTNYFDWMSDSNIAFANRFPEKNLSTPILTATDLLNLKNINDIPLMLGCIKSRLDRISSNNSDPQTGF